MNPTEIYRGAIQRTFSDLYGVSPKSVAVAWADDGESITVDARERHSEIKPAASPMTSSVRTKIQSLSH